MSKTLEPMKWVWGAYVRELLAVVHAVKVWRLYIMGWKFMIVTYQ